MCSNAGKMVSIENGPNIARPPSSKARERSEILGAVSVSCEDFESFTAQG